MSAALFPYSKYQAYFDQLSVAEHRVLLSDYDGTLAPFVAERSLAFPYPEIPQLLRQIAESGTRVIIVSGRRAMEIPSLLGLDHVVEVWGCHGLERLWPDSTFVGADIPYETAEALKAAGGMLVVCGFAEHLEFKPGCVAVHWRGVPISRQREIEAAAHRAFSAFTGVVGLEVLPFDHGLELRYRRATKAFVIERVLTEIPKPRAIAYLGDDLTDEDAFHALRAEGLSVLVRERYRDSAADVWIKNPTQLFSFFEQWLNATGGSR